MSAQMHLDHYGCRVSVSVPDLTLLALVMSLLPRWFVALPASDIPVQRSYDVTLSSETTCHTHVDGEAIHPLLLTDQPLVLAMESLRSDLETWIAVTSPEYVFIHAGSVAINGKVVAIPGRSHAGKTTLTAELVRQGAAYLSDEYVLLDQAGLVHAYPRDLALRGTVEQPTGFSRVTAADLGGHNQEEPLPLGLVLSVTYDPAQREPLIVEPLSPANGALALFADCASARAHPDASMTAISTAVGGASARRGTRGQAPDAARAVVELVQSL